VGCGCLADVKAREDGRPLGEGPAGDDGGDRECGAVQPLMRKEFPARRPMTAWMRSRCLRRFASKSSYDMRLGLTWSRPAYAEVSQT